MFLFLISFIIWALVHSWTAALGPKEWFRRQFGETAYQGLYRLSYNLFSLLSFLPVLYFSWRLLPGRIVWQAAPPWSLLLLAIQLGGLIGLLVSLLQTDVLAFTGLRQAYWYLNGAGGDLPAVPFITSGVYSLVRHPLYLFSLLVIWFNPRMSVGGLIFNGMVTLYLWFGSLYEEKKLAAEFGTAYAVYSRRVPRILPMPWRRGGETHT